MNEQPSKTPTRTPWVQQFYKEGQTRDCMHGRLARSCEICELLEALHESRQDVIQLKAEAENWKRAHMESAGAANRNAAMFDELREKLEAAKK